MTSRFRRRELLVTGASIGVTSLAGCSGLLGGDSADGWPMYQYDSAHTGAHPSAEGPGDTLDERWATTADSLADHHDADAIADLSPPVVTDGTAYVTVATLRQGNGASLVALDVADGSKQWQTTIHEEFTDTGGGPIPQPTVLGDVVVAALPGVAPGPSAVAVDADSGEVQWRSSDPMTITPGTAWDGTVAFGHWTAHALASDGSLVWEYAEGEEPPFVAVNAPPTITDDGVYVATTEGVHALDHDGNREWTRDLAFTTEPYSQPTSPLMPVAGDSLYVTTSTAPGLGDGRLVALDPADGTTRWEFKPPVDAERRERLVREYEESGEVETLDVGVFAPPALHDGTLYAYGRQFLEADQPPSVPHLYAVDASTGERQWATQLSPFFTNAPPVIADGTVYVATEANIVAIDAESGDQLASVDPGDLVTGLALNGDRLFVAKPDEIVALGP